MLHQLPQPAVLVWAVAEAWARLDHHFDLLYVRQARQCVLVLRRQYAGGRIEDIATLEKDNEARLRRTGARTRQTSADVLYLRNIIATIITELSKAVVFRSSSPAYTPCAHPLHSRVWPLTESDTGL